MVERVSRTYVDFPGGDDGGPDLGLPESAYI